MSKSYEVHPPLESRACSTVKASV